MTRPDPAKIADPVTRGSEACLWEFGCSYTWVNIANFKAKQTAAASRGFLVIAPTFLLFMLTLQRTPTYCEYCGWSLFGWLLGWRFGLVVASLGVSTKLLYVEPG